MLMVYRYCLINNISKRPLAKDHGCQTLSEMQSRKKNDFFNYLFSSICVSYRVLCPGIGIVTSFISF